MMPYINSLFCLLMENDKLQEILKLQTNRGSIPRAYISVPILSYLHPFLYNPRNDNLHLIL